MAFKVCIDPGHNPTGTGIDTGAEGNGLYEQDLVLAIAKRLKPLLEANGFEVMLTRDSGKVPGNYTTTAGCLSARCQIANSWGADIFVAIHINAGGGTGTEVYICGTGGRAEQLANHMIQKLVSACGWANRGIKVANFAVLSGTNMPAILTENGFIDTASDASKLKDINFLQAIAVAHAKAICEYFGVSYKETSDPVPVVTNPDKPKVMYRVIIDGKQVMALSDQGNAEAEVKNEIDGGKGTKGVVQRNSDGVNVFEYTKPTPADNTTPITPVVTPSVDPTPVVTVPKTSIVGTETVSVEQCDQYLAKQNPTAPKLASLYKAYGTMLGIKWGYAFAQMIKETGYLKFGGDVMASQNNFAGIGAVGGGASGASFSTPEEGVIAQLEHLYAYASVDALPNTLPKLDPRFDLVHRGIAPNWEDLDGKWAVPGNGYGEDIVAIYNNICREVVVATPVTPVVVPPVVVTPSDSKGDTVVIPVTDATTPSEPKITLQSVMLQLFDKAHTATFWVGIIGLIKLITDQFGYKLPDVQWDSVANDLASLATLVGVIASHNKDK